MTAEQETIKQLLADREAMQAEIAQLRSDLAAERSEREAAQEKADKAIEYMSGVLAQMHGKDGIQVNLPIIGLDPAALQSAVGPIPEAGVDYDVNLIVSGVLTVVSDKLAAAPSAEEEA